VLRFRRTTDRKHFTPPASLADSAIMYIDFEGVQTKSQVWLNGHFLGSWDYGYTGQRYYVNSTVLNIGAENVLVVRVSRARMFFALSVFLSFLSICSLL